MIRLFYPFFSVEMLLQFKSKHFSFFSAFYLFYHSMRMNINRGKSVLTIPATGRDWKLRECVTFSHKTLPRDHLRSLTLRELHFLGSANAVRKCWVLRSIKTLQHESGTKHCSNNNKFQPFLLAFLQSSLLICLQKLIHSSLQLHDTNVPV